MSVGAAISTAVNMAEMAGTGVAPEVTLPLMAMQHSGKIIGAVLIVIALILIAGSAFAIGVFKWTTVGWIGVATGFVFAIGGGYFVYKK